MTAPTPLPRPNPRTTPVAPAAEKSPGLNDSGAETRRRIVVDLLPYITDVDDLLMVAAWIETREETDEEAPQ